MAMIDILGRLIPSADDNDEDLRINANMVQYFHQYTDKVYIYFECGNESRWIIASEPIHVIQAKLNSAGVKLIARNMHNPTSPHSITGYINPELVAYCIKMSGGWYKAYFLKDSSVSIDATV